MSLVDDIKNRFKYRAPDEAKRALHEDVRWAATDFAVYLAGVVPEGRELSLALTKIDEVLFWANAGIARNE